MGKLQPALGHHLHQVAKAELIAQVLANAQNDDLSIEMPPENNSSTLFILSPITPIRNSLQQRLYPRRTRYCTRTADSDNPRERAALLSRAGEWPIW
jgi:hypothetical protein